MTETLPFNIPGYIVQGLAGRGGMGRVYRAEQIATRRPVAIKLLTGGVVDAARLATFRREASTLAGLEHPHIVPLYDYGEHDGIPYLVVRFFPGGTVADRLKSGPIDLNQAVPWIADVADALDAAHRRGVTHRDVKPSNMLLDEAGHIYLGDFGIAATAIDLAGSPHSGSAAYASPEQARGETPDARSDIYSLAASAFEMLTGRKPYEAETALGMMVRHMHDPVPSARAARRDLTAAVDEAIASGMAKRPDDRPATAGEFGSRLREAASIPPEKGEPAEPAPRPRRSGTRPILIGGVVLAVFVCLGGLGLLGGGLAARLAAPVADPTSTRPAATVPAFEPTTAAEVPGLPFRDDFSDPSSGFVEDQDPDGGLEYADGEYLITILTPGIEWIGPHQHVAERDLLVQVDARRVDGPVESEIGIVCRWQDSQNYIAAALRGDGMVSIWRRSAGVDERLLEWMPLPAGQISPGPMNTLTLSCDGPEVVFSVDGVPVATAPDPSPAEGSLALLAGLLAPGEMAAAFDNLEVGRP